MITVKNNDSNSRVNLQGRVDSTNAPAVEKQIFEGLADNTENIIIDAEKLEFISSAGLRVILRLRKTYKNIEIIGVSSEVYEILDMTGFTEMMPVKKAYRRLSVDNCEIIGKGANGAVYRYD